MLLSVTLFADRLASRRLTLWRGCDSPEYVNILGKFRFCTLGVAAILSLGTVAALGATPKPHNTNQIFDKDQSYVDWSRTGRQPLRSHEDPKRDSDELVPPAIPLPAMIRDGKLVTRAEALARANEKVSRKGAPSLGNAPVLVPRLKAPPSSARTSASTSQIYNSSCDAELRMGSATPAPPASGNPFAIAKEELQIVNLLNYGYLQADGTSPGNGKVVTTPLAQTPFYTGFKWPSNYPPNSSVTVTMKPQWVGAIAVLSQGYLGGLSQASGSFTATQGFFNSTLNKWENLQPMAQLSQTATDGDLHKFYFDRSAGAGNLQSYTFGINLVPGQTYYYYNYAQAQGKAESDVGGPSGAAVDFGSLGLDSPATIQDSNGNDVNGFYLPGTPQTNSYGMNWYKLKFSVPNKIVVCNDLG